MQLRRTQTNIECTYPIQCIWGTLVWNYGEGPDGILAADGPCGKSLSHFLPALRSSADLGNFRDRPDTFGHHRFFSRIDHALSSGPPGYERGHLAPAQPPDCRLSLHR